MENQKEVTNSEATEQEPSRSTAVRGSSKFVVGCSPLTNRLYAGSVKKDGQWGAIKHDVTDTAVGAVAQHLLQAEEMLQFSYKGGKYLLKVEKI